MKVLFVSSGNANGGISPIVKNQGESLRAEGIDIEYFPIKGKGAKGYIKAMLKLRKHLKDNSYDIIHAHYWISAIVATLAGGKRIVVSLMGDDVKTKEWFKWIIFIFHRFFWTKTIVKSEDMFDAFGQEDVYVVPNGIDMKRFRPIDKTEAFEVTKWDKDKKHILFTSDPKREEKNYKLAKDAVEFLNDDNLELHYLVNIENEKIPYYYNSASVVVLTSTREGSPNAIKETMACNIPIVSTDVGDVKSVISDTDGCYIASFDVENFASKIEKALEFGYRTEGRNHIKHLKSEIIAQRIIAIYKSALKEK